MLVAANVAIFVTRSKGDPTFFLAFLKILSIFKACILADSILQVTFIFAIYHTRIAAAWTFFVAAIQCLLTATCFLWSVVTGVRFSISAVILALWALEFCVIGFGTERLVHTFPALFVALCSRVTILIWIMAMAFVAFFFLIFFAIIRIRGWRTGLSDATILYEVGLHSIGQNSCGSG